MRLLFALLFVLFAVPASAQILPVPSGPVTFCGVQALPTADTYTVSVDGGAAQALTMDATIDARCPSESTHSFQLPASLFTVGTHTVTVTATNPFGSTVGPTYSVVVGIRPGTFTINSVLPPSGE